MDARGTMAELDRLGADLDRGVAALTRARRDREAAAADEVAAYAARGPSDGYEAVSNAAALAEGDVVLVLDLLNGSAVPGVVPAGELTMGPDGLRDAGDRGRPRAALTDPARGTLALRRLAGGGAPDVAPFGQARLGPAFARTVAATAAERDAGAAVRAARGAAAGLLGCPSASTAASARHGALASALLALGVGEEPSDATVALLHAAPFGAAAALALDVLGAGWTAAAAALRGHPDLAEGGERARGGPEPVTWDVTPMRLGGFKAVVAEGTLAAFPARGAGEGAVVTFRPLLPPGTTEGGRDAMAREAGALTAEWHRVLAMAPAGQAMDGDGPGRAATLGDATAAVEAGLAADPAGDWREALRGAGFREDATDGDPRRWRRAGSRGTYALRVGSSVVSLDYGRRGWQGSDALFSGTRGPEATLAAGRHERWPERLETEAALVAMALAVHARHASDGREAADRRPAKGRKGRSGRREAAASP